jgi:hypothetical protein
MLEIVFDTEALTSVRFAISPTIELVASTAVLEDPSRGALHLPWVERARPRTADLDLSSLRALQGSNTYNPDFIHPVPTSPLTRFEEELDSMVATPPEQIRAEVHVAYEGHPIPAVLSPFLAEPRAAVRGLAELMAATGSRRSPMTGSESARCSSTTSSTAPARSPTAARARCSRTSTRRSAGMTACCASTRTAADTRSSGAGGWTSTSAGCC